jgi:hypothetical protein
MSNPAKAKGTRWESVIVAFLNAIGIKVYRPAQSGFKDTGDIHGADPFIIQAKDWKSWEAAIREGLDGAEVQARNAGMPFGVAIVKRARRPVGKAYVVMSLDTFGAVLRMLRGLPAEHIEQD